MSLNLFKRLMPAEEAFTPLFCEQAQRIVQAAAELRQMIGEDNPGERQHVPIIREIEMAADAVARRIFISANRTFNAPIDREDILALAHVLDDCVDLIEDTAKGIQRYDVREFPAEMRAMADAVVEAAEVLQKVMPHLDSVAKDHKAIAALCEQVGEIEGRADESFDLALTRLRAQLRAGEIDTIGYIDRKELYELIENVVDKCDDVANADCPHDGLAYHAPETDPGFLRRNRGCSDALSGDSVGSTGLHHAYDHGRHRGRRRGAPSGGRSLACRAADRDRVGSDAPGGGPVGRFGLQSGQFLLTS